MNKYGAISEETRSDYDYAKKAEYYDEQGYTLADETNKYLLSAPRPIQEISKEIKKHD
jgi:cell division protein FtsI/penicillin-binding protein 2